MTNHNINYKAPVVGSLVDNALDSATFIRDEIDYNSNGDVVEIRKYYYDKNNQVVARKKRFTPRNGDTNKSGNSLIIYAWEDA